MRRGNLFWGVLLILFGGLLFLQTMGFLQNINVWGLLWPVFLILLGIWILASRHLRRSAPGEHITVPLQDAARAKVRLNHGAGRLKIGAAAESGYLLEGDCNGGVNVQTQRRGDLLDVELSVPTQSVPFLGDAAYSLDWNLNFNSQIPLNMELNTGAQESQVDLSSLKVTEIHLQTGASATELILPANAGFTRLSVETGAASVNVRIPENVAASIRSQSGLASVIVNEARFPRSGSINQSPDYETSANKVEISIQVGVGSVEVR